MIASQEVSRDHVIPSTKWFLQYIGETERRLRDRFNEHRWPIINTSSGYTLTAVSHDHVAILARGRWEGWGTSK